MRKLALSLQLAVPVLLVALAASSCFPSRGTVRAGTSDPLVIIDAGTARFQGGAGYYVRYLVDRSTRTCWLVFGEAVAPLSCCVLNRVPTARKFLSWKVCSANPAPTPRTPQPATKPPRAPTRNVPQ